MLLVGETPIEQWDAVALDGESRTSVVLAQILLKGPRNRPGVRVYPVDAGTGAFHASGKTGALVIGDAARNLPERLTTRVDLGRVWNAWTGLPFVFAVWAGRPDLDPAAVAGIRTAAETGLAERAFAPEQDRHYLTENIRYTLDDKALMGLRRFAALGHAAGLLNRESFSLYGPTPDPAPPPGRPRHPPVPGADGERLTLEEGVPPRDRGRASRTSANAAHLRRLAPSPGPRGDLHHLPQHQLHQRVRHGVQVLRVLPAQEPQRGVRPDQGPAATRRSPSSKRAAASRSCSRAA